MTRSDGSRGPIEEDTMRLALLALLPFFLATIGGCVSLPPPLPPGLLHDSLFRPLPAPIDPGEAFALSPAMREFAQRARATARRSGDLRSTLIADLQPGGRLRLADDSTSTRHAAQAFEARAGNCLSLALMTAALAREMGLEATLQAVQGEDSYMRLGDLVFASGHVNLLLARPLNPHSHLAAEADRELTIDFLPGRELRGQRVQRLSDATAQAMYLNNRAAEVLEQGRAQEAYWWARAAVLQDPGYLPAINTLGVVYLREGHTEPAEAAFRAVLERAPRHLSAMSNLVNLLGRTQRTAEAETWSQRLQALQPHAPFERLDQGRAAFAAGQIALARELFTAELRQQPYQPEVHFWLAVAHQRLGDGARAESHLAQAVDHSTSPAMQTLYAAKLQRLRNAGRGR
jgi:Flp pilus assembly protein TadD